MTHFACAKFVRENKKEFIPGLYIVQKICIVVQRRYFLIFFYQSF